MGKKGVRGIGLSDIAHAGSMECNFDDWLRQSIGIGDDWSIDSANFRMNPPALDVGVSFCGRPVCPVCGKECPGYDKRQRVWRDLDFGGSRCNIAADFPRIRCREHGIREIEIPWVGKTSKLTLAFEQACLRYARVMPVRLASELLDVSESTIWRIVKHTADMRMRELDLSRMTRFCIDETSYRKGHKYVTSVVDPDTGAVVFMTLGKDATAMAEFRTWLIHHGGDPHKIEVISCDMGKAYIAGAKEYFPEATVCFDHFHVVKLANDALDKVRKQVGFKGAKGRGIRFWLMRNREDLEKDKKNVIDLLSDQYDDLGTVYSVKEALRDMYRLPDRESAMRFIFMIIDRCLDSKNDTIFTLGLSLDEHIHGILAWFDKRISNGRAEGVNSVIQAVKRTARGFTNPENMIAVTYLRNLRKNGLELST